MDGAGVKWSAKKCSQLLPGPFNDGRLAGMRVRRKRVAGPDKRHYLLLSSLFESEICIHTDHGHASRQIQHPSRYDAPGSLPWAWLLGSLVARSSARARATCQQYLHTRSPRSDLTCGPLRWRAMACDGLCDCAPLPLDRSRNA